MVTPLIASKSSEFKPISDIALKSQGEYIQYAFDLVMISCFLYFIADWVERVICLLDENDIILAERLDFMSRLIDHASYCSANGVYIKCPLAR